MINLVQIFHKIYFVENVALQLGISEKFVIPTSFMIEFTKLKINFCDQRLKKAIAGADFQKWP